MRRCLHARIFTLSALLVLTALARNALADDVMSWPVHSPQIFNHRSFDYEVQQNFGKHNGAEPGYHTGADLTTIDRVSAANARVFAAADGTVECANTDADDYHLGATFAENSYPGRVLVVSHQLADGSTIYFQYGHLNFCDQSGTPCPRPGDPIHRGDWIGTMIPQSKDGAPNSHVHFEVRLHRHYSYGMHHTTDDPYAPGDGTKAIGCAGPGYVGDVPGSEGWLSPIEFYFDRSHRALPVTVVAWTGGTLDIRATPSAQGQKLGELAAGGAMCATEVARDQSYVTGTTHCEVGPADTAGGCDWWYRVDYQGNAAYIKAFKREDYGSTLLLFEAPGECSRPIATPTLTGENRGTTNELTITPVPARATVDVQRRTDLQSPMAPPLMVAASRVSARGLGFALVASDGVDTTYDDPDLGPGARYCYQATVTLDGVTSAPSNEVCLTTPEAVGCTCTDGVDRFGDPVDPAATYCGFQVCGTDFQTWQCSAGGWTALGSSCGGLDGVCTCTGGTDSSGTPVDPAGTFCGLQICASDFQAWQCGRDGWTALDAPCGDGTFTCPAIAWSNSCGEQQSGTPQQLVCNPYDDLYRCDWGPGDPPGIGHWDLLQIGDCQASLGRVCVPPPDAFYACPAMPDACGASITGAPRQMICGDTISYECVQGGSVIDGSWVADPAQPAAWVARPDLGSCSPSCRSDDSAYVCPDIMWSNACGEPQSGTPQSFACNPFDDLYQCVQDEGDPPGAGHWDLRWIGGCLENQGLTCTPPPSSFYTCGGGADVCGAPITGVPNQIVCGAGGVRYQCAPDTGASTGGAWTARTDLGPCGDTCDRPGTFTCGESPGLCWMPQTGVQQQLNCTPYDDVMQCVQDPSDPPGAGHWSVVWLGGCSAFTGLTCDGS
jgi:murein DD-endopeptidase MepM/ murein hydrolase activator NlpD